MTPAAITAPELAAPHGFFTRAGGVSEGLYASLNCGRGSEDDAAAVAENRARVAGGLGVAPEALAGAFQIHSADAVDARPGEFPRADALVSNRPGVAISVLTADCAPILMADAEAGVVGAAHAGWRGALDGIIDAAVALMCEKGAAPGRIAAVVGPCISQRAYEVGEEFMERFCDEDMDHSRFFAPGPSGRPHFDLPGFALARLRALGVENSRWTGHCTYSDEGRFFSFRRTTHRGEPDYGRQISAIALPAAP